MFTCEKNINSKNNNVTNLLMGKEKVILIGVLLPSKKRIFVEDCLEELSSLCNTAGAEVVDFYIQKRKKIDSAYFIGKGKIVQIQKKHLTNGKINTIVFDDDLSPAQQRNLEEITGIKIVDRTRLILDIFAKRAYSKEGKLQVELAQLTYLLPRLMGKGIALSQQAGGIGTKGPGEKKLEIDRRRIKSRIFVLKKEIEKIKKHRALQRERRKQIPLPMVTLIGYTNAGKSTLFNTLAKASIFVENKLFATLDPTIRQIILPDGQKALLADTVGFIRKLPHQLITAFRATLEEVSQADILLHIIDSTHKNKQEQIKATYQVLEELGIENKQIVNVYNKIDLLPTEIKQKELRGEKGIFVSALKSEGILLLLNTISGLLEKELVRATIVIPSSESSIISKIFDKSVVLKKKYNKDKLTLEVKLAKKHAEKFKEYIVKTVELV